MSTDISLAVIQALWYAFGMKRVFSVSLLVFMTICATACLSACSGKMGYSVVLWSVPEQNLFDGDIVPVYVRSNISKVYIIGIPASKQKLEVPLWRITEPESKRKAQKTAQRLAEYRRKYAFAVLDGLPIRSEPINTTKQVYRLRINEVIKVLYRGKGQTVMAGKNPLDGNWLRVLTEDGTKGWCFSHNLRLFDERESKTIKTEQKNEEKDSLLEEILLKEWVPEFYKSMTVAGKINIDRIKPEYGFDTGAESGFVSINLPEINAGEEYRGTEKTGTNTYSFTDASFTMTVFSPDSISVRYVGKNGLPVSYNFISLTKSGILELLPLSTFSTSNSESEEDGQSDESFFSALPAAKKKESVEALIAGETERRVNQYRSLVSYGPVFVSSNYGTLQLNDDQSFTWKNFKLLVSSGILPQSLKRGSAVRGTAQIKYFISDALEQQFDGVLTFSVSGVENEVNFLYKIEETGLLLEDTRGAVLQNGLVQLRSRNPSVLFFVKQ